MRGAPIIAAVLLAGLGCGKSANRDGKANPAASRIHAIPTLVGATRLWVSPGGEWIAGQLPIESAEIWKEPIELVERARYRLVDRAGEVAGEGAGIVLAPPTDQGKLCRLVAGPWIAPS